MTTPLLSTAWLRRGALMLGTLLGAGAAAHGQALNYTTSQASNVAGTFTDLSTVTGSTVISTANFDDANSAAQSIGFTFGYNNASFTQFVLNTNGLIRLGSAAPSAANMFQNYEGGAVNGVDPIGSTAAADVNLLAPFNFDLQSGTGGAEYRVATTGTSPSRVCTIQWKNVSDKTDFYAKQYAAFTFQLKLYEGSNRIEFVYGPATASTNAATVRFPTVGIKGSGSASGQDVLANKTASTSAWSTTTFITGIYGSSTHNFRADVPPDLGRTYRFDPSVANDASVNTIYTLGKLSRVVSLPHTVQAVVANQGTSALTNLVVTLSVAGANTFTDTKTVASLAAGATTTVTFAAYPTTLNLGTNNVTVSVPNDANNTNNTQTYTQQITTDQLLIADATVGSIGTLSYSSTAAGGILASKFTATGTAPKVANAVFYFGPASTATTQYQAVLYTANTAGTAPGSVLYTSATQTRPSAGGTATVSLNNTTVPNTFFIGIKEVGTTGAGLGTQPEVPLRTGTFVYSADGITWNDVAAAGPTFQVRLLIEAGLTPATTTCAAVTNLAASNVTTTGATLNFTPATGITSYTITYTPAGGTAQTVAATGSPVTLAGLTPGTAYTVSVVTNCGSGSTSAPVTATFTTLTPCPAVTGLTANNVTSTSATLLFTAASGATTYTVTYTPAGGTAQTVSATSSPVTLAGLTPGTTYTVSVVTNCGSGNTSTAATTTFTTLTPCTAVTGLTASNVTTTGATLTFTPATGISSYTVTYTPAGGTAQTVAATGSPVTLAGLAPGTTYTVSIVTNCGSGQTSAAATTTFTTLTPCAAVTGLSASNVTATGATLSFTPASGATTYTIIYTPAGGTTQTITVSSSPVTLAALQAGKQYTVSIVTNCGSGQTSAAATTTFTTPAPAPTNATVSGITSSGASIGFTAASGATSYTITYTPQGGTPVTVTVTAPPAALTGLLANTAYTVTIVANYPGGAASSAATVSFTTAQVTAVRSALAGGELAVYPNPAHRVFTVSLPALGSARTAEVLLVNTLGQVVSRQTITLLAGGTQAAIEAAGLATGVYAVQVRVGGETAVARLLLN